ncbi:DUF6843 domain-containing protein [Paenibacillus sp. GCM10027626]|uniref:DUF6843 domain-containing protein n=1 Tax=Paenibacillus sp. GCM10027626 TaxID=3273411 RepID=UPI00362EE053
MKSLDTNRESLSSGYIGKVEVEYSVDGAPALPRDDRASIHHIPNSRVLQTSAKMKPGRNEFFYVVKRTECSLVC